MTTNKFIQNLYQQFNLNKSEIDIVLCYVLNINTAQLFIYDKQISTKTQQTIIDVLKQRTDGKPMAYITGTKHFWTLDLIVNQHTLIPRPETELIVELILKWTTDNFSGKILDLGTGTGAIALSIAQLRPLAKISAIDSSKECVNTAQLNQKKYTLDNVKIYQSNWFVNIANEKFDFIVSNPPYIAEDDKHLEALKYEPITALSAKNNGFSDLEHIIQKAQLYLKSGGTLLLEHGYNQSQTIQKMLSENNYTCIKSHHDLAGIPRVTTAIVNRT
jgi:release factor glutamine methyltransferase